ncbi:uncharacterized protein LOC135942592 [Cloeon dipterum]|uniref:uncharacterized protein LOC135942592 n=1 Tax=Cloeon dipterum TaxID=197152 RepID=UPI00321FB2D2
MLGLESPEAATAERSTLLAGSKLSVSDSFDEDNSDDADDEVFIQDGKNGRPKGTGAAVKRPLMPPRRKVHKSIPFESNIHRRALIRALKGPCCFALLFLSIFIIAVGSLSIFFNSFLSERKWKEQKASELVTPSELYSKIVWNVTFHGIYPTSTLFAVDANSDGVLDVILAFGTAVDRIDDPGFVCAVYFEGHYPCYGGILALDGSTGQQLWRFWTESAVQSLDCSADLTDDKVNDCVAADKSGVLQAINGHDGSRIWSFPSTTPMQLSDGGDQLNPRFVPDMNEDGKQDLVVGYNSASNVCGHSSTYPQGHLLLLNGATGEVLQCLEVMDHANITTAPTLIVMAEGSNHLLMSLAVLDQAKLVLMPLHPQLGVISDVLKELPVNGKSSISTPLLVDLNDDGTADVIVSSRGDLVAIDGRSLEQMWTLQKSDNYVVNGPILAGYFSNDSVPDIIVKYSIPGRDYQEIIILDGSTGKLIISSILAAKGGANAPSASLEGFGNDVFLYWSPTCTFDKEANIDCAKDENTTSALELQVLLPNKNSSFPLYKLISNGDNPDEDWRMASTYLNTHPDFWDQYVRLICAAESSAEEALSAQQQESVENVGYQKQHNVRKHGRLPEETQPLYSDYDTGSNYRPSYEDARPRREAHSYVLPTITSSGILLPRFNQYEEGLDLVYTLSTPTPDDPIPTAYQQCLVNKISQLKSSRRRILMASCQRQAKDVALECWKEATQMTSATRPFGATRMARLTVHRQTIQLKCSDQVLKDGQRCAALLPWNMQSLPRGQARSNLFFPRNIGQ